MTTLQSLVDDYTEEELRNFIEVNERYGLMLKAALQVKIFSEAIKKIAAVIRGGQWEL